MKVKKANKPFTIYSENEKMDTSGMAGKPFPMELYTYEMTVPKMNVREMLEVKAKKEAKK